MSPLLAVLAGWLLLSSPLMAEDMFVYLPGAHTVVHFAGGDVLEGGLSKIDENAITLATDKGLRVIPLPLVQEIEVDGKVVALDEVSKAAEAWRATQRARVEVSPRPWIPATASALWAGAGYAVLHEPRSALAYSIVELGLLGAGGWMLHVEEYGNAIIAGVLDVFLHGYTATEVAREARWRRRTLGIAIIPCGRGAWSASIRLGAPGVTETAPTFHAGRAESFLTQPADSCIGGLDR
jgi:hypothetical protein